MHLEMSVSKILAYMVLQNYQNVTEMTSNMIYIVALGDGLKCPRKIYLNTQCKGGGHCVLKWVLRGHFLRIKMPQ